jgi:hypothetical protein
MWLTLSFLVKASAADHVRVRLSDNTSGGNEAVYSGYHTGGGDWERLTAVKQVRTGLTGEALWPHGFGILAGLEFAQSSQVAYVDGATLVIGNFPQGIPFIPLNPADDMNRCGRFYEASEGTNSTYLMGYCELSGANLSTYVRFSSKKAANPTITIVNPYRYFGDSSRSLTASGIRPSSFHAFLGNGTFAGYQEWYFDWTAEVT